MDSALYTKPYAVSESAAVYLPGHVAWLVLPRYISEDEHGTQTVDERITVVLRDEPGRFWPVIAKMSVGEAESLHGELGRIIAQRRAADGSDG